jgi:hypothetical protein
MEANTAASSKSESDSPIVTPKSEPISNFSNDSETFYEPGGDYSTIRHTRPWIDNQGVSTVVPITILGKEPLSVDRRVYLQRQGLRTSILGWVIGGLLGGTIGKELDVTPRKEAIWTAGVEKTRRDQYDSEVTQFLESNLGPKDHKALETHMAHVPVYSGDNIFRICIYPTGSSRSPIVSTAPFRIYGPNSVVPAKYEVWTIISLILEFPVKLVSLVWSMMVWMCFYAAYPTLKFVETVFGASGVKMMNMAHGLAEGLCGEKAEGEIKTAQVERNVSQNIDVLDI